LIRGSATSRDAVGLRFMGFVYQNGIGIRQDYDLARQYYEAAILRGDEGSCSHLGLMYLQGLGLPQNKAKALELFTQGEERGDIWSMVALGDYYDQVGRQGSQVDPVSRASQARALKFYTEAAAAGNGMAALRLAAKYEEGRGVSQDYKQALSFYIGAAKKGIPQAQVAIGRFYEDGLSVGADSTTAYVYYGMAARNGSAEGARSQQRLAARMTADQSENAESLLNKAMAAPIVK
jgi:TPR repeat protein